MIVLGRKAARRMMGGVLPGTAAADAVTVVTADARVLRRVSLRCGALRVARV